jgi:hypothetical protein
MEKFPFIHSVLALTVSSPRSRGNCIGLSPYFGEDDEDLDDDHENDDATIAGVVDLGKEDKLTKKERAILEFFIAQLRLQSQKSMKYWEMIAPLANHTIGQRRNPPNHPLHGAGCTKQVLWQNLDTLFDEHQPVQKDAITHKFSLSMAFDNYQRSIPKT